MKKTFTFIDLFAGIGGMRMAFDKAGCECVFSSEIDEYACQTYAFNFDDIPSGDITKIKSRDIPDHDILVGGFPCQPFSSSGMRKGLQDSRGKLFFEIVRIIKKKKPQAFLLENVPGLLSIDNGNTFKAIIRVLTALDYQVQYEVLSSASYVAQKRQRVFIVGFKNKTWFNFPEKWVSKKPTVKDILEKDVDKKYNLSQRAIAGVRKTALMLQKDPRYGGGFGNVPITPEQQSYTLLKNKSSVPIIQNEDIRLRYMTPTECLRLMGLDQLYPAFSMPVSDSRAYGLLGNSVVPPLIYDIAKEMLKSLEGA